LLAGTVSALLALVCATLFDKIGATVDAQGVLHEPFFLLPLAWLCGIAALVFGMCYRRVRRR
jgi:hypothetical protein